MTSRKIYTIIKWILYAVPVIPLVYISSVFYPFITTKVFLFRTLIEVAAALSVILYVWGGRGYIQFHYAKKRYAWLPLAGLTVAWIASLAGIDMYHSFWSISDRLDGLLTLTHLVVYFYTILFLFTRRDYYTFFNVAFVVAVLVSIYGFLQRMAPALNIQWLIETPLNRIGSTLGNAAFFASYLVFMMFASGYASLKAEAISQKRVYALGAIFFFAALFIANTRGAMLGVIAGMGVSALSFAFLGDEVSRRFKKVIVFVVVLGSMFFAGLFVFSSQIAQTNAPELVKRIARISLTDATTVSRLFVWKHSIRQTLEDKPLLGYGQESISTVYNDFYDPTVISEEWFDRSHNIFTDVLVQNGVIGLGINLLVYVVLLVLVYALYMRGRRNEAFVLLGLITAYLIQNMFVFDTVNTSILFYALYGYMFSEVFKDENIQVSNRDTYSVLVKAAAVVIALTLIASGYWFNIKPLQANIYLGEGYRFMVVDNARSLDALNKGLSLGTYMDVDYGYQSYNMYFTLQNYFNDTEITPFYDYAVDLLKHNIEKYPYDVRAYVYLGHIYEAHPNTREVNLSEFKEILQKAQELSPMRSQAYYMMANIYLNQETLAATPEEKTAFYEQAKAVIEEYVKMVPHYAEPRIILANMYIGHNEIEKAQAEVLLAEESYTSPMVSIARRFVSYYINTQQYEQAIPHLEFVVQRRPTEYNSWFDLSQLYYSQGRYEDAVEALNEVYEGDIDLFNKNILFSEKLQEIYNNQTR